MPPIINREQLLAAAAAFSSSSSSSSGEGDSSEGEGRSSKRRRTDSRKHRHHSSGGGGSKKKKERKERRSRKPGRKDEAGRSSGSRPHKRSEAEKIAELERRAAALGAAGSRLPGGGGLGSALLGGGRRVGAPAGAGGANDGGVVLDTEGDPHNALYESLYAGDVPRYRRLDPLNLVATRRLGWQPGMPDSDAGNVAADRYFRGRFFLQERSRSAKRLQLGDLRPQQQPQQQHLARPRPPVAPLLPPGRDEAAGGGVGTAAPAAAHAQQQSDDSGGGGSGGSRRLVVPAPAFIPLEPPAELLQAATGAGPEQPQQRQQPGAWLGGEHAARSVEPSALVEQAGHTPDELLLQATRAWNVAVRERPHDEQLWLDFAAFQHSAAALVQGPRSRLGAMDPATAEKQISLLTRGLSHHPSSAALLLALLRCYAVVAPDAAALEAKWTGVLERQAGSWELWREYLSLRQSSFADFKVPSLQRAFHSSLHALHLELLGTRRRAGAAHRAQPAGQEAALAAQQQLGLLAPSATSAAAGTAGLVPLAAGEEVLELQLVQLLLGLLHVELEAGYTEQALGKMQSLLEFHLFPPPTPPGGQSALLRLFAAFWASGAPRIGEAGARGWAYWCCWHAMGLEPPAAPAQREAEQATAEQEDAAEPEPEPLGWSGWFEAPPAAQQPAPAQEQLPPQEQKQEQPQQPPEPRKRHASGGEPDAGSGSGSEDAAGGKHRRGGRGSDASDASDASEAAGGSDDEAAARAAAEEEQEEGQLEEELDEVELMLQLGVELEAKLQQVEQQGLPAHVLARWVHEEAARCASQWQPLRSQAADAEAAADGAEAAPPDPARIVGVLEVEPCLMQLRSQTALRRLVLGCAELLGAPLGAWCSSNSPTPQQQLSLPPDGSADAASGSPPGWSNAAADGGHAAGGDLAAQPSAEQQEQAAAWFSASDERWQWLVNLLQRLVAGGPCSAWPELCNALVALHARKPSQAAPAGEAAAAAPAPGLVLTLDGASGGGGAAGGAGGWPSAAQLAAARSAAKQLLSDQQDNLLLYDAYGCFEAAAGQAKTARRVLETALGLAAAAAAASAPAAGEPGAAEPAPSDAGAAAPLLALHLAQLELAAGGKAGLARARAALHACLAQEPLQPTGGGAAGQPGQLPEQALARARRGFQARVPQLLASAGGALSPPAAATIAAAALFELSIGLTQGEVAAGLDAAAAVFRQVTSAVPLAVRAASAQHEQLQQLHCHMLVTAAAGGRGSLVPAPGSFCSDGSGAAAGGACATAASAAALAAAVSPARARRVLAAALELYPHSTGLLRLQVALDRACFTLAGLRRQLAVLADTDPSPGLWAVALQAEASRPGGRSRMRAMFERALAPPAPLVAHQQRRSARQRLAAAWEAAGIGSPLPQEAPQGQAQQQQAQGQGQQDAAAARRQQLLAPASAASSAAAALDAALADGSRGWGACASLWRRYIAFELQQGRLDAARKLFLRAVHACPGSKALWLAGLGGVCGGLQPRECSGLTAVLQEREVLLRADVYEALLAQLAEEQQQQQQGA